MAVNYQLELERELQKNEGKTPRLLLHCCCAPCSSYVLEYLSPHFSITAHYYNPNIDTPEEYAHRARELSRFVQEMPLPGAVDVLAEPYTPAEFYAAVKGLEDIPEGGRRCYECYRLRLRRAAQAAGQGNPLIVHAGRLDALTDQQTDHRDRRHTGDPERRNIHNLLLSGQHKAALSHLTKRPGLV